MSRSGRVTIGLGLALLSHCVEPRTDLVAVVDSEVPWGPGARIQSVRVEVRRGGPNGALRSQRVSSLGDPPARTRLPLRVGLHESTGDPTAPVWIEALGCAGPNGCDRDDAVVAQRALVPFRRDATETFPLLLASACVGVRCTVDERCAPESGRCEPASTASVGGEVVDAGACPAGTGCGPSTAWVRTWGARARSTTLRTVARSESGGVVVGGGAAPGVMFGASTVSGSASEAPVLASLSAEGAPRWFLQFGPSGAVDDIVATPVGDVVVAGHFFGSIDGDAGPITLESGGFLARVSDAGQRRWIRPLPGASLYSLSASPDGGVVALGVVSGDDSGLEGVADLGPRGESFLAAFGADGATRWARRLGRMESSARVALASDGTIYLTGAHREALDLGGGTLAADGTTQTVVARFGADGAHRWSRHFPAGSMSYGNAVVALASGGCVVGGAFDRAIDFGLGPLESAGRLDGFVVRFEDDGRARWARRFGSATGPADVVYDLAARGDEVVMVGTVRGPTDYGLGVVRYGSTTEAFVAGLTLNGETRWVRQYGGDGDTIPGRVAITGDDVLVMGGLRGAVNFGAGPVGPVGASDSFLLRLAP